MNETQDTLINTSYRARLSEAKEATASFNADMLERLEIIQNLLVAVEQSRNQMIQTRSRALELIRMERDTALRMIREAQSGSTRAADEERRRETSGGRVITE